MFSQLFFRFWQSIFADFRHQKNQRIQSKFELTMKINIH